MTDQRDRARAEQVERIGWDIVDCWYIKHDEIKANVKQRRELADLITAALADAERRGMERAAKIVSDEPELEGEIPYGIRVALQASSLEEITRAAVRATKWCILANIAKAQATQEEG